MASKYRLPKGKLHLSGTIQVAPCHRACQDLFAGLLDLSFLDSLHAALGARFGEDECTQQGTRNKNCLKNANFRLKPLPTQLLS